MYSRSAKRLRYGKNRSNKKLKKFLESNDIYFRTVAATLLSGMAILISCQQCSISRDQNKILVQQSETMNVQKDIQAKQIDLTNVQIELTKQQISHSKEFDKAQIALAKKQSDTADKQLSISTTQQQTADMEHKIQKRAEFMSILNAFDGILHKLTTGGDTFGTGKLFSQMTKEEKIKHLDSIMNTLLTTRNNQILLKNSEVLSFWGNSYRHLHLCKDILTYKIEHIGIPDDSDPTNNEK